MSTAASVASSVAEEYSSMRPTGKPGDPAHFDGLAHNLFEPALLFNGRASDDPDARVRRLRAAVLKKMRAPVPANGEWRNA
jgi:hypothetical protein